MNPKERIKELVKNDTTVNSIAELERKLDIANGTINKWDKSQPTLRVLEKIADYFQVSLDSLLDRKTVDNNVIDIVKDDAVFAFDGHEVTEDEKLMIRSIIEQYRKNKNDGK